MGARFAFEAVIFDMDGVLVDTELYYAGQLESFGRSLGLELPYEVTHGQVGNSHQDFQRLMVDLHERAGFGRLSAAQAVARYDAWAMGNAADYAGLLNPGAAETLEALRGRGVRTALASSSPMANIRLVLDACGLSELFEVIVSGEQFEQSKPAPDIYLHVLDALGLPARACCCVEDSVPGIAAGKAAGLFVVAKREERFGFSQDAADIIIDELPELLELQR